MAELGFLGIAIPQEHGGAGLDALSYALAMEEISAACASCGVIMSVNNSLFCDPVYKFGTDDAEEGVLTPVAHGEKLGCFGLTEPMSGSDAQTMVTGAEKTERRLGPQRREELDHQRPPRRLHHRLRGDRSQRSPKVKHTAFLVESGTPGYTQNAPDHKLGIHAAHSCTVFFENCKVPATTRSSATSATASRSRWRRSTAAASASPRRRSASRAPRSSASVALRQGAKELRRADRAAPGDPVHARRHGDADRRRAPAHVARRDDEGQGRAPHARERRGQALRERDGDARRAQGASRSTAATATRPSSPSSATTATRASPRSTKARARSSASSSPPALLKA